MYWCLQVSPSFSIRVRFPVMETFRFPYNICGVSSEWEHSQSDPSATSGFWYPLWAPFSLWRNWRLRGDLFSWCCSGLGEGHCVQCVSLLFSYLLMVLVSWWRACFSFLLIFWDSLGGVLFLSSCSLFSWRGAKTGMICFAILVTSLPDNVMFFNVSCSIARWSWAWGAYDEPFSPLLI